MGWAEKEIEYLYSQSFKEVVEKLPSILREFYVRSVSERPLSLGLGEKLKINEKYEIDKKQRDRLLKKFEFLVKTKPGTIYKIIEEYENEKKEYFNQPTFDNLVKLYSYQLKWYYPYKLLGQLLSEVYINENNPTYMEALDTLLMSSIPPAFLVESEGSSVSLTPRKEILRKKEIIKEEILDKCKTPLPLASALIDGINFTIDQNEELRIIRDRFFGEKYSKFFKWKF